jgi:hypothetical protein
MPGGSGENREHTNSDPLNLAGMTLMDLARRPQDDVEVFSYQCNYVAQVPEGDILETLARQLRSIPGFIRAIPAEAFEAIHPPYGWTIRTVIEHCCDAERVFGYRALRFATNDGVDLPGWDENHFASCGYAGGGMISDLADEFHASRFSNLLLLQRLQPTAWDRFGTANGMRATVRTQAWLMAGHWLHHEQILRKRLGIEAV